MRVVVSRSVADALAGSRWQGVEDGWVLLGRVEDGTMIVADLIDAGLKAERGAGHVTFDRDHLASQLATKRRADPTLSVVGTAHTHPPENPGPSEWDLDAAWAWVPKLRHRFGVFCVMSGDESTWFTVARVAA